MEYSLEFTKQYLKDLRLARKRGLDESKLNEIIKMLLCGKTLPLKNKDHALKGEFAGFRECHISPDWLLVYSKDTVLKIVELTRTGSHSDLFG